jgi:CheY-like chemotaxis protein
MLIKQVLLIDDDRDELGIFMDALKEINGPYNCSYANGADQALQMVHTNVPDFIFVDYNMPLVNGIQLLAVFKNEPKLKKAKIFIYSANITEEVHKMARVFGASGCIEKPNKISRLTHDFKAIFSGDLLPRFAYLTAN